MPKEFDVTIVETLKMKVTVEADSLEDAEQLSKTKYNIDIYTRQLKKLRREIDACGGVLERMDSVREKLTRIESEKFRGKDRLKNEHISRSGRSSSENVT